MSEALNPPEPVDVPEAGAAVPDTVGRCLRAGREAAGLSIADVAQSLKFSPRQIELIEADNYAALPGVTIVRGFTRSYARLLKLDADALLKLLDGRTPNQASDVRPPDNMGEAGDQVAPRQFSWLASTAIVIALAAALLALWHYIGPQARPLAEVVSGKSAGGKIAEPVAPPPQVPVSSPVQPVAEHATTQVSSAAAPASPAVPPAAMADPHPPAASAPVAAVETLPSLKFVFNGRAWLEVTDARKQVLHSGQNPAGSELVLQGQPPFDVVVGNATKVKMRFGERDIDLGPHTRAEVARLKVQ